MNTALLITCEHGGFRVPATYRALFAGRERLLRSHRGWDRGSLELAKCFASQEQAALQCSTVTRLLVELNRSPRHPQLFSELTAGLSPQERERILERYYEPYREAVRRWIAEPSRRDFTVLHLSVHTFTPVRRGVPRRADIGLLYDPKRDLEREFCRVWQRNLAVLRSELKTRRNYPYQGKADGLTTSLRKQFAPQTYVGVELEVNQRWPRRGGQAWRELQQHLIRSFTAARSQVAWPLPPRPTG